MTFLYLIKMQHEYPCNKSSKLYSNHLYCLCTLTFTKLQKQYRSDLQFRTQKIIEWDTPFLDFLLTESLSSLTDARIKSSKSSIFFILDQAIFKMRKVGRSLCLRNSVLNYESLRYASSKAMCQQYLHKQAQRKSSSCDCSSPASILIITETTEVHSRFPTGACTAV